MVFTSSFCLFSLGRVAFKEKGGSLAGPMVFHKEEIGCPAMISRLMWSLSYSFAYFWCALLSGKEGIIGWACVCSFNKRRQFT